MIATLALVGLVIIVSALLSGLAEKRGLPQVAILLALGAALGAPGLGFVSFELESTALRVVATLGLTLVLFTDAVSINIRQLKGSGRLPWIVLGPGTILPALLIAGSAYLLVDLSVAGAIVVGAALASTDPVMLRGILRRTDISEDARLALRLESGLNDVVLLPLLVLAMLFLAGRPPGAGELWGHAAGLFLLGPVAGILVGLVGIRVLVFVRRLTGVRRDYESIYALGVALTAFAGAEAMHGSGFLAAFAAGMTIAALDVELCDCFLDFGQASAEIFLLLTFVVFGAGPIWAGLEVLDWRIVVFGLVALVARTVVLLPVLRLTPMDESSRRLVAWFGPRGLSTLLLALLPVFAGLPGSRQLFAICSAVVLLSVVVHGAALAIYSRRADRKADNPSTEGGAALDGGSATIASLPPGERISLAELNGLRGRGEQVIVLDVRKPATYSADGVRAKDAVRLPPDEAVALAARLNLPKGAILAAYCT